MMSKRTEMTAKVARFLAKKRLWTLYTPPMIRKKRELKKHLYGARSNYNKRGSYDNT